MKKMIITALATLVIFCHTKASITLPDGTDKLRFSCTAPKGGGILIDEVRIHEPAPMKIPSVTCKQVVTPVLVRNEADPLLQILVSVSGNLQPIGIKKIQLLISGVALIESISIQHAGTGKKFEAAKDPAAIMVFSESKSVILPLKNVNGRERKR